MAHSLDSLGSQKAPAAYIAVCGPTGAGKVFGAALERRTLAHGCLSLQSTLVNAILGSIVVPTSGEGGGLDHQMVHVGRIANVIFSQHALRLSRKYLTRREV